MSRKGLNPAAEQILLDQCRQQDYDAFSRIVDAYQARVFGFVRRMVRSEEEAMDVTQEVFIKAFQAVHRFDGRSSLRTWLFRIAHNLCIDRSRRADRAPAFQTLEPTQEDDRPREFSDRRWSPDDFLMTDQLRLVVEEAIESMSDKLKSVLLLHDREGLGYDEIASTLELPVGTVKSRLFLARQHVQGCVTEYMDGGER